MPAPEARGLSRSGRLGQLAERDLARSSEARRRDIRRPLGEASVWLAAVDRRDRFHTPARALIDESAAPLAALDLTLYEVAHAVPARMTGWTLVSGDLADPIRRGLAVAPTEATR